MVNCNAFISDDFVSYIFIHQELVSDPEHPPTSHLIRLIEGFETVTFRSKFSEWPLTDDDSVE